MVRLLFGNKIKIWRKYRALFFLRLFSRRYGQASVVDVQLCAYVFLFFLAFVWLSKIFCHACVSTPLWDTCHSLPTSLCALLLESWVGLCEGQYGPGGWGGGAGGLCWQACRPDPWLQSFFRAEALAVITGSSSRRRVMCCNTQRRVGVIIVI